MADDIEQVEYSFTGDVSSLRQATTAAISLLDRYQNEIDKISADGGFGKSSRAAKSFQSNLTSLTKTATKLQGQLKSVTDAKLPKGSEVSRQMTEGLASIQQVWGKLTSSSSLTTKEVQSLTNQLKAAKQAMTSSAPAVDALVQKELKWQGTLDNVRNKTSQFRNALDSIPRAVNAAFAPLTAKLNSLQNPFARIVASLQTFKDRAANSFGKVTQLASTVASAFRRVSSAEDAASNASDRASKKHGSLSNILNKLRGMFIKETKAVKDEDEALDKKNSTINTSNRRHNALLQSLTNLGNRFRRETNSVALFSGSINGLSLKFRSLSSIMTMLPLMALGKMLSKAANQSISYAENLNLFTVATGDAFDESMKFIGAMQELYGMDPSNLMRYAGNFYQLADAIDMPDEAAANLSLGLTKATNDIASLFNVDVEQVFNDLSSGMQGMSRAVRKYGMDIRATTLQTTAATYGITEQVENMSEANRQALRFITMMRQASNANGDFAKTIEQPANQLRIFKEQMSQLGRAIGDLFIKPLSVAIQYINGFVMALRMIISFIGSLLGVFGGVEKVESGAADQADRVASGIGGIGSAAKDTTKKLKAMLAPFDELTVLESPDTGGGGVGGGGGIGDLGTLDPALLKAIEEMSWKLDEVKMKAVEVRDSILEFLGFKVEDGTILSWDPNILEKNLIGKFPQWTKTIQAVFDNWSGIIEGFKAVFESIVGVVQRVWEKVSSVITDDSASTFITNLSTNLQDLATWIEEHTDSIANFVLAFGAFKLLAPILPLLGQIVTFVINLISYIPQVVAVLSALNPATAAIAAVIALVAFTLADLIITNEEFRNKIIEAWNNIVEVVSQLWNEILKPILSRIGESIKKLYTEQIKPIVEKIATIILDLWNDILKPVISWLIDVLGPSIRGLVDNILDIVDWLFSNVGNFIQGLLTAIQGIVDFIAGVFTGDWERAWKGVVNIFIGIFNAVVSVASAILNAIISVINAAISVIWNGLMGLINMALDAVNGLGSLFGASWSFKVDASAPQIPYVTAQIPEVKLAKGGVVTGPTTALIGEAGRDEMVMPLDNSPQMREFADTIASRVNNGEQVVLLREQNSLLRQILEKTGVSIDGRMLTEVVSNHQSQMSRALGV